jgi:hypothetical protein
MPRPRWTTPEQFNWLNAQKPAFSQAVDKDATAEFYQKIRQEFCEKWPLSVTQAEIDKEGSAEKAEAAKRDKTNNVCCILVIKYPQGTVLTYLNPEASYDMVP